MENEANKEGCGLFILAECVSNVCKTVLVLDEIHILFKTFEKC